MSTQEITNLKHVIMKLVQSSRFQKAICRLKRDSELPITSKLECLYPFLDKHGRVSIKEGRDRGKKTAKTYICLFFDKGISY